MEDLSGGERSKNILDVKDCVATAIELLANEDTFGAVLQLQRARYLLGSLPEGRPEKTAEIHDWGVLDPYTAQCRLCGKRRPLGVEERTLMPLALR